MRVATHEQDGQPGVVARGPLCPAGAPARSRARALLGTSWLVLAAGLVLAPATASGAPPTALANAASESLAQPLPAAALPDGPAAETPPDETPPADPPPSETPPSETPPASGEAPGGTMSPPPAPQPTGVRPAPPVVQRDYPAPPPGRNVLPAPMQAPPPWRGPRPGASGTSVYRRPGTSSRQPAGFPPQPDPRRLPVSGRGVAEPPIAFPAPGRAVPMGEAPMGEVPMGEVPAGALPAEASPAGVVVPGIAAPEVPAGGSDPIAPRATPAPGPGDIPDPWDMPLAGPDPVVSYPEAPGAWIPERDGPVPPPAAPLVDMARGPGAVEPAVRSPATPSTPAEPVLPPAPGEPWTLPAPPGGETPATGPAGGLEPATEPLGDEAGASPEASAPAAAGERGPSLGEEPLPPATRAPLAAQDLELPSVSDFPLLPGEAPPSLAASAAPENPLGSSSPWLPGASDTGPGRDAATPAAPFDPWQPAAPEGGAGTRAVDPPADASDPWGFKTDGVAPGRDVSSRDVRSPDVPGPDVGSHDTPAPGGTDPSGLGPEAPFDPWAGEAPSPGTAPGATAGTGGASPGAPAYAGRTPAEQAREHATRLRDRPGDPALVGFPAGLLLRADARVALRPGSRPAVVALVDDASRESDLAAATLLPMFVGHGDAFDFVAVEARPRGSDDAARDTLRRTYLRDVPTFVVLPPDRRAPRLFSGRIDAAEVEIALVEALRQAPADPRDDGTGPAPTGPGEFRDPADAGREPWAPGAPGGTPLPGPLAGTVEQHAARLRQVAGDPAVVGYPAALVRPAEARTVFDPGPRPVVILFYDDSSKASDLQAADFLGVLARRAGDVDVVPVDVSVRARWDTMQKKIVHTYYMSFVPTTVVLTARRVPVKSWYQRVSGEQLDLAIDEALRRR